MRCTTRPASAQRAGVEHPVGVDHDGAVGGPGGDRLRVEVANSPQGVITTTTSAPVAGLEGRADADEVRGPDRVERHGRVVAADARVRRGRRAA
jgi:hypothetical protein